MCGERMTFRESATLWCFYRKLSPREYTYASIHLPKLRLIVSSSRPHVSVTRFIYSQSILEEDVVRRRMVTSRTIHVYILIAGFGP